MWSFCGVLYRALLQDWYRRFHVGLCCTKSWSASVLSTNVFGTDHLLERRKMSCVQQSKLEMKREVICIIHSICFILTSFPTTWGSGLCLLLVYPQSLAQHGYLTGAKVFIERIHLKNAPTNGSIPLLITCCTIKQGPLWLFFRHTRGLMNWGNGKSISRSFEETVSRRMLFSPNKVVLLADNIAEHHIQEVTWALRNPPHLLRRRPTPT